MDNGSKAKVEEPVVEAVENVAELDHLEEVWEWLESFDSVLQSGGPALARRVVEGVRDRAIASGVDFPFTANTPYVNTIPASHEAAIPRRPGNGTPHQESGPLERSGDGCPCQPG